jgi:hypothetical protein
MPMRMIFSIPCCFSCWSRSVLAKPLCAQCSLIIMSPSCGTKSGCHSPPQVPFAKIWFLAPASCLGSRVLPMGIVSRFPAVMVMPARRATSTIDFRLDSGGCGGCAARSQVGSHRAVSGVNAVVPVVIETPISGRTAVPPEAAFEPQSYLRWTSTPPEIVCLIVGFARIACGKPISTRLMSSSRLI